MRKTFVMTCLLAAAFLFLAASASAALVTQWSYLNDATFVDWANEAGTQSNTSLSLDGKTLSWGVPANPENEQSSLVLNAPVGGDDLFTDAGVVDVVSITHFNNVISGLFPNLAFGRVEATVQFTPFAPPGDARPVDTAFLEFLFFETPNDEVTPMDIFILTDPGLTSDFFYYDGYRYDFEFTSTGFGPITGAYDEYIVSQLGVDIDYFGWLTEEDGATPAQFRLGITASPVPEPTTMLLLGAGLLGLGIAVRRNKKI